MNEAPVCGVVVAHGNMAAGLVDAVRSITGAPPDVLVALSNRGLSPNALADAARQACTTSRTIVFTDLPSGSCGFAGRVLAREAERLAVICGVNLPMLLDFVTHRELALDELVERLVARGKAAITATPPSLQPHGNPALPR